MAVCAAPWSCAAWTIIRRGGVIRSTCSPTSRKAATPALTCMRSCIARPALVALFVASWAAHAGSPALEVCYGFECSTRHEVTLSAAQWQEIRQIFIPAAPSAQQERAMVRHAIAQMETFTGALTGSADMGG